MAYSVARRTREIGIRMALGAAGAAIARRVVGEAGWLVAGGLAIGLGGAWALGALAKSIREQLYGVTPLDPPTLAAAALGLALVAALAALVPAYRAAHVSPMTALRDE